MIAKDELAYKFKNELHANEIVLLAYYIAAINIEHVYHSIMGGDFVPFDGICLTDTFALYEKEDLATAIVADNGSRRRKQKKLDIRVIVGNPPYSAGQSSGNDNNANIEYPTLDDSIRRTYAAHSTATLKNSLYDSYIRAIRWASDRIGSSGVIAYVSNGGYIDANTADGLRKCLASEFSSIYIFHLRGNARTSGEVRRKEKDNVFGQGTRTPVAISILVKNPNATQHGQIFIHDIGDYLSREEKLERISNFVSIDGIKAVNGWLPITPDQHNDWINQRDNSFGEFISLGEKRDSGMPTVFVDYSSGVKTNRDAWCYNASRLGLEHNVVRMIDFYNVEVNRFKSASIGLSKSDRLDPEVFVIKDTTKISWTREVYADVGKGHSRAFVPAGVYKSLYRPFTNQWMYFNQHFNNCVYQMPRMFPDTTVRNLVICVTGRGSTKGFSALMTDKVPDLEMVSKGQCFALKIYEPVPGLELPGVDVTEQVDLFASEPDKDATAQEYIGPTGRYWVNDGIGDAALAYFVQIYGGAKITKEDLFYYTYGLLHSEDYRARYADNLSKELPRLPPVKKFEDFQAFTAAGRKLAAIHVGFEDVAPHPITVEGGKLLLSTFTDADYRVTQMKFANKGDKTRVIYNHRITISDIPSEAFDYVVNGKPALEWVMERQAVTTHKDSGIVNDANQWAIETIGDASYPLQLFQKVITVSLETLKIVHGLPRLDLLVRTN